MNIFCTSNLKLSNIKSVFSPTNNKDLLKPLNHKSQYYDYIRFMLLYRKSLNVEKKTVAPMTSTL